METPVGSQEVRWQEVRARKIENLAVIPVGNGRATSPRTL